MKNPEQDATKIEFAQVIVNPLATLPAAIEWINDNLQPESVFDEEKLEQWAAARGFIKSEDRT